MKSSLAAAVGAEATLLNVPTAIIDLDREHRTLADWAKAREDLEPGYPIVPVYPVETAVQAIKHDEGETLIVIDSPSRASTATVKIAKAADLVVQPILAGSLKHAKLAHETFTELAEKGIAPSKMVYVLTRYLSDKQCADTREYIATFPVKGTTIAIVDTAIPEKTGYRQAISNGFTITEASHVKQRDIAKACVSDLLTLLFHG